MSAFWHGLAFGLTVCLDAVLVVAVLAGVRSRRHAALTRRLQPNGLAVGPPIRGTLSDVYDETERRVSA